ncbi:MAG: DUF3267 domain-containing protein [Ruminococcus sp.]|nr:DUF3267 domain-containing protein [Ruminococcus sp.]
MRNIVFSKEKFKEESQLKIGGTILDNAVEITQSHSIIHRLIPEFLITASVIAAVLFSGIFLIRACDKSTPQTDLKFAAEAISVVIICFIVLPYVHEIIHALMYPAKAEKTIWKTSNTYFVYCEAEISRKRMVFMLIMPLIILGLLPFVLWIIFIQSLSAELAYIFLIADIYMIFTCLSDIGAIWITLRFVPQDAKVFSYGAHYYYRKKGRQ